MAGLGGLRRPCPDSQNTGWRNASFRKFADYMQTSEFETNLRTLIELSKQEQIVLMCAEAVPWRCHRSLIADALLALKIQVNPFKSPLKKGDSGGCVFSGLFYNPLAPFFKGDFLSATTKNPLK